jgi:DNA processing protein
VIDRDDIGAWVRLLATPGIGPDSARRLLAAFGSANAIFAASDTSLREVVGAVAATALTEQASEVEEQVARALAWLDEGSPEVRGIVTLGDARYPPSLLETADPPLLLYTQGRCDLLHAKAIAVVGSRNPTPRIRMIDGFNEGWIDFAEHKARKGRITIDQAIAALVAGAG